jgi:hypothetical protein
VTKNIIKYFDMDYDIPNVIKDSHKHFDVEYDMKVNHKFHVLICYLKCLIFFLKGGQ